MILITGCGRSGTDYTTEALRAIGINVRHEKIGRNGRLIGAGHLVNLNTASLTSSFTK